MKNIDDYRCLSGWCVPMYSYIEGDEHPNYWADSQNCEYYFETNKEFRKKHELDKKKYWLIIPMVPKSVERITEENQDEVEVAYFVDWSNVEEDIDKEFDMGLNKVINE